MPNPTKNNSIHNEIAETAERIVIDYANLSGREDLNRAEFRNRTIDHIINFAYQQQSELLERVKLEVQKWQRQQEIKFSKNGNYDGNELYTACDYYGIASAGWPEIIRLETGAKSVLSSSNELLESLDSLIDKN